MALVHISHASKSRQRLVDIGKEISFCLNSIITAKSLTKGTICKKIRKCGNPHCKCSRGELHTTRILSLSHEGRSKIIHLGKYSFLALSQLEKRVKAYQRFRTARARLTNSLKLLIAEINMLEHYLLTEVPHKGAAHGTQKENI
jgi:hypothetical protein